MSIANSAPLQLYYSGIAFAPGESIIRRKFKEEPLKMITALPITKQSWNAHLQTLWGHLGRVTTVVFSPDGQMVASGSRDCTIRLWDSKTGKELQTLQGHSDLVGTVAFSPDGQMVASGSDDRTVRLWDSKTGVLQKALYANGKISFVRFSTQGSCLETNCGSFEIHPFDSDRHLIPDELKPQVSLEEDWVALRGVKVLWLPFEYRQPNCLAIKDGALALGYRNGRVCIMEFHITHPYIY
jgi:WD40 repeat protein